MVREGEVECPYCGGPLKHYDNVQRIVRTKDRKTTWISIQRLRCTSCHKIHRELPVFLLPYKQYEAEIITGVCEGLISCETLGYEDYPCELTMIRWRSQYLP